MRAPKVIGRMGLGLFSPDLIRKISVVRVMTADTYDEDGYSIEKGLMDPHLGVIDPGIKCRTCGGRFGECLGHFGHVELARPVVHVGYVKLLFSIMKAICRECSRIKLPYTSPIGIVIAIEMNENHMNCHVPCPMAFQFCSPVHSATFT